MHFSNKEVVTSGCARFCSCQLQMRKQALKELLQVNIKGFVHTLQPSPVLHHN